MDESEHTTEIPADCDGRRFDQALAAMFPEFSRARLQGWIRDGRALLDGRIATPKSRVRAGQSVALTPEAEPAVAADPEPIALEVVHADPHVLVINKPAGLVVHPGAGNPSGTLLNGLLHYEPNLERVPRAGILHRLDKDTTGLLLVARSVAAHTRLVRELEARRIRREYRAVCNDRLTAGGSIDAPIGRHPSQRVRMAVSDAGKPAVTHYRVLARFAAHSFVAVRLETGRTHQIRVHFAHAGHALVGDPVYGGRPRLPRGAEPRVVEALQGFRRQALHASDLVFRHPDTGAELALHAPLPADIRQLLAALETQPGTDFEALRWP